MEGWLFVIWVAIPCSLFLYALLHAAVRYLFPRDEDTPINSKRIFRQANLFAVYAVLCLAVDQYLFPLIGPKGPHLQLSEETIKQIRYALLPAFAITGFVFLLMRSVLKPPQGFDRLRLQVHGSHPLTILIAFGLMIAVLMDRPGKGKFVPWTFALREKPSSTAHATASVSISGTSSSVSSTQTSSKSGTSPVTATARLRRLFGLDQTTSSTSPKSITAGGKPDYNSEGYYRLGPMIEKAAADEGVDPFLVLAIIEIGSGFNERWENTQSGKRGLMPMSDNIAQSFGARTVTHPTQNVRAGCRYLKSLLSEFDFDARRAVAAFYSGKESVQKAHGVPDDKETKEFVERVLSAYGIIKAHGGMQ